MGITIAGTGITKFGELWHEGVESLARLAAAEALEEAKLKLSDVDWLIVGNMLLSQLEKRAHGGRVIGEAIGYDGPSFLVEAACASGGMAAHQGVMAIEAGMAKTVLVVGVEKMTDVDMGTITRALIGAGSENEQLAGATFPALYALMHQEWVNKKGLTEAEIAKVAVEAHKKAENNPLAQFTKEITIGQVLKSPLVADPIRQLHCAPISDGAAAVVLRAQGEGRRAKGQDVKLIGSGVGGDTLSLSLRKSLLSLRASKQAFRAATNKIFNFQFSIAKVGVAEVHDCFSIAQIMAIKDLELGMTAEINPSGGLKACGHPVGATGVKQVAYVTRYLREKGGVGLTHNVGGSGATAVVHLLANSS